MAIQLQISPNRADVQELFRAMEDLRRTGRSLRRPMGQIALYTRRASQRRLRNRPREWGARTGRLSKSLAIRVSETGFAVGSNLVYAAIQQLGGEIRPKRKYLAIPVDSSVRRSGSWPRDFPAGALAYKPAARIRIGRHSWVGPALVRKRDEAPKVESDGKVRKRDEGGRFAKKAAQKGDVVFALVKRVRIRGRPYLVFNRDAQLFALRAIAAEYQRKLPGQRGGQP